MEKFISCDWGTSVFRLRLIETETQNVLAEVKTAQGIAATYTSWKDSALDKFSFYCSVISVGIKTLEQDCGYALDQLTVVISGMASSTIGMIELNYKELPFKTDGTDLLIKIVDPSEYFKHSMIIISGVRSATDVIRGEETILSGCDIIKDDKEQLFIFPGTHSKHIIVKNGIATNFKTYMSGEFFDLLSTKSILSASVEKSNNVKEDKNNLDFEKGILAAGSANLLNSAFHVRTNQLFNKFTPTQNYHYLSGLLIGTELKDLPYNNHTQVMLVSAERPGQLYLQALQILSIDNVHYINADKALIMGQCIIFKQYHLIKSLS